MKFCVYRKLFNLNICCSFHNILAPFKTFLFIFMQLITIKLYSLKTSVSFSFHFFSIICSHQTRFYFFVTQFFILGRFLVQLLSLPSAHSVIISTSTSCFFTLVNFWLLFIDKAFSSLQSDESSLYYKPFEIFS